MNTQLQKTKGYTIINNWLSSKGLKPFAYQEETWQHIINRKSGLVNAPTGTGKTFSIFLGCLIQFINQHPDAYQSQPKNGLQLIWITPLRALAKDIGRAMEEVILELGMQWKVGIRNGYTSISEHQKQKRQMPEVLIITPESLHLLLAQKHYSEIFETLKIIAVDEWHELIGSKRGVQVELAISRIAGGHPDLPGGKATKAQPLFNQDEATNRKTPKGEACEQAIPPGEPEGAAFSLWGISATIGNLNQAMEVLLSPLSFWRGVRGEVVRTRLKKQIEVESIIPDEIEKYPWAGHLGIKLAEKVLPIINESRTTLIFINTEA